MVDRVSVLLAAGGEAWEAAALRRLADAGVVVVKRCVDLPDLLATAATGAAEVAVVAGRLVALDADAVGRLRAQDVACVAVGGDPEELAAVGVSIVVPDDLGEDSDLSEAVATAGRRSPAPEPSVPDAPPDRGRTPGRVVTVHGPAGAPGRTTLAIGLAAVHAHSGIRTVLVDADPYGGAVAQHLGVLDEVSGLLAAARLVGSGSLDPASFAACLREVTRRLEVLTGLPRPDRWVEARPGVLESVVACAAETADVVLDTGFSLEDDVWSGRSMSRNQLTLEALASADEVLVVGSAEPTGLARLARSLVEVRDTTSAPVRVVVNRMRDSLGWRRRDIVGMVEGYVRATGIHFLPEDRPTTDRAHVAGRSVVELGDSPLRGALSEIHDAVFGAVASAGTGEDVGERQDPAPMSR